MIHKSVLLKEVLEVLDIKENNNYVDCTCGEGGHSAAILEKNGPSGRLLAIDWDKSQSEKCKKNLERFGNRAVVTNDNYANLKEILKKENFGLVNGVLLDLGFSSAQLENKKGFSFQKDDLLDMRYGDGELTAAEIVNNWSEKEIEKILREYGEEKFSKKIAEKIVKKRETLRQAQGGKIEKTGQLAQIIESAIPKKFQRGKIHPATRTFQALRIAVNRELENIQKALYQVAEALDPKGRMVIISFHSLEDRIVKNFIKNKK